MSLDATARPSLTTSGTYTLRLRPAKLFLFLRLRVEQATRELGLVALRRESNDTRQRLERLGAELVALGEPHEDEQAESDPYARHHAEITKRFSPPDEETLPERPAVNALLRAVWDISTLSPEQVLMLVDRLRFESAVDPERAAPLPPPQTPEEIRDSWSSKLRKQLGPNEPDLSAKFLYLARPTDEEVVAALATAYARAREIADQSARAIGRHLGELKSLITNIDATHHRAARFLESQCSAALLTASDYVPQPNDIVSDNSRAVEFAVSVTATHDITGP